MKTFIQNSVPFAANADPIRTIEFVVEVAGEIVVRTTIDLPPDSQGFARSPFEIERLATVLTPIATRLARVAVPELGRNSKVFINV